MCGPKMIQREIKHVSVTAVSYLLNSTFTSLNIFFSPYLHREQEELVSPVSLPLSFPQIFLHFHKSFDAYFSRKS